jgi:hypothetical protein
MLKNASSTTLSASEVDDLAAEALAVAGSEDLAEEDSSELTYSLSDLAIWEILSNSLCEDDSDEQAAALAKVRISNYHSPSHLKRHITVSPSRSTTRSMSLTQMVKLRE